MNTIATQKEDVGNGAIKKEPILCHLAISTLKQTVNGASLQSKTYAQKEKTANGIVIA